MKHDWQAISERDPFEAFDGEDEVRELAERFYDAMERTEPGLTALHRCDAPGKVSRDSRERFALFLIGWLGGPMHYVERHGHPRLRMRHAPFPVNVAMRDAWIRAMTIAMDEMKISGDLRAFLDTRFADVANFMRNVEE